MQDRPVGISLPQNLFHGNTAIVTGSSRGVGRATSLRLAEAGANVVVNYLTRKDDADEVVAECEAKGVEAIAVQADTSFAADAERLAKTATETFGGIDLLVINAGIWEGAPIDQLSETLWDRVLDTNLKSAWAMSHACVPFMKQRPSGSIVMVSSTSGQRGEANYSCYSASKGGMISFTKALATELAPQIRVNCVAPGWIDTAMVRPTMETGEYLETVLNSIPMRRMASTDDVALSICFLLSDWARHITGEIVNINGGAVLCG
jgi:3-oxoacyl-[acyl-carrier protein] reductase